MEPVVISSADEELEVSGRSVIHQEMHVVRELPGEEESLRNDQEQDAEKNTEEHPLVAMKPAVIFLATEEGPEISDLLVNHQEIDTVRELSTDEDSWWDDYPFVTSIYQAVSLLRSQYRAGKIDSGETIGKLTSLYKINRLDYLTVSFSLCLLVLDVVSDISLGIRYLTKEDWVYAGFTLGVVIAASLIQQAMNWKWSLWKKPRRKKWLWLWIGPYMAFNMEPGYLYVRNLKRIGKIHRYKKQKKIAKLMLCWEKFMDEYCLVADRKQWEAQLEAGPQMILQIYILLKTSASLSLDFTTVLQLLALVTSLLGLTATSFTQYKTACLEKVQRIRFCPVVLRAIGESFPIGCRAVAIAAIMSVRPVWGGLVLGCHWLAATGWGWYTYRKGVAAAIAGLGFILSTPPATPQTAIVCNVLWWTEEVVMLVLWWTVTYFSAALTLLCVTLAVELVFRIVFYILYINDNKLSEKIRF